VAAAGRCGNASGRGRSSRSRAARDEIEPFDDRHRRTGNGVHASGGRWSFVMSDTIVLLHGSATGSSSWDAVAGSLVSAGARVFAPDLLGYGRSPAPSGSYGIAEEVAHLVRLLAADHEAAAHFFVDHWNGGAWDWMGKRGRAMVPSLVPKLRLEMTATRSDTATLGWLAESPPPTTILVGERTLLAPRAVARLLAPALAATTVTVSGAGHMIPITHPAAVVDAVRRAMVARNRSQGART